MKTKFIVLVCLVLACAGMACRFSGKAISNIARTGATSTPKTVSESTTTIAESLDIPYKNIPGVKTGLLNLDIYMAEGASREPVMVYVHGGAWSMGDKSAVTVKDDYFVQNGFVFVSVNYRLYPEVQFPAHAEDVASAIAWVYGNISDYGGDPERIFLMGHSAGAHLVALVSTDEHYLQTEGLELDVIKGVIPLDTQGYDITRVIDEEEGESSVYLDVFGSEPESWQFASPSTYIGSGKGIPPMAVAYSGGMLGMGDPFRQQAAEDFVAQLQEAGVNALLIPASEKTHMEINEEFGEPGDYVTDAAMDFINALLR